MMRGTLSSSLRCIANEHLQLSQRALTCSGAKRWSTTGATGKRQWSTPLAKSLGEAITTTGPIPVATYMRQCLTSMDGGYYTSAAEGRDQFGQKGDFVTSPEISQIFGELIGLWVVAEWIAQGRKSDGVYLMEMGPGRGTLMDDMLRTIRNFKPLAHAIQGIYLVEASPSLREAQHKLLCGDNPLTETDIGHSSTSKYTPDLQIIWCEDIRFLPKDANTSPFIIAHEFFDALPIHVFESIPPAPAPTQIQTPTGPITPRTTSQSQQNQWRELLVSPTSPFATHKSLNTPRAHLDEPVPDFQLTRAKASTPHSLYLPETSQRYKALKKVDHAVIEISPESLSYAADFGVRIGGGESPVASALYTASKEGASLPDEANQQNQAPARKAPGSIIGGGGAKRAVQTVIKDSPSGAALILDYGTPASIPINSLRGIKQHRLVSPFHEPGRVDLSADVDFIALAEAALDASLGVEVHGPVDQARFLEAMGIQERAAQLVKKAVDMERGAEAEAKKGQGERRKEELTEVVKRIESGWKRLVDRGPQGMGKLYQVMAIVPHKPAPQSQAPRRPVGFGGDVQI
ncbi:putative S-adenosyl-L-methionine-dependent methyltransferase-domain-containing protein [Delphinella strobiligena]|nr:putative S-adenosyl-L-methionine-dependent methyltransferase-domain-containing protein [Delphinella strobiligena]